MPERSLHDVVRLEPGVADGLVHGDIVPAQARFHEAAGLARDHAFPFDVRLAVHLAAEAELGVFFRTHDARLCFPQRGEHLLGIVSDRGNDPHARHDHASHKTTLSSPPPTASPRTRARAASGSCAAPWHSLTRPRVVLPLEQSDTQIGSGIDDLPVRLHDAVGNRQLQLAQDHALQIDHILHGLGGGSHHACEFDLAHAQRAALAGCAEPAKEEAGELPQRIEPEAARHDGIALEVAFQDQSSMDCRQLSARRRPSLCHARRLSPKWLAMRSNISIGGRGNCALPAPNSRPCPHSSRS